MENTRKQWVVKAAGAGALTMLLAVPSFGQSRNGRDGRRDDRDRQTTTLRTYRDNERVSAQGRVQSFSHERDGYRVYLDRGRESYWVPQSYVRGRDLRVGVSISLGGVFRRGAVYVDAVNWPDGGGYYDNQLLTGVVERVDARRGLAEIRDRRSGRVVEVDFRSDRRGRLGVEDLRRGDYVELSGSWSRGAFDVYDIEAVRDRY